MNIPITIFTPTYNRALLLPRVFKSLQAQTCYAFEWLIVDDGSTDQTEELIHSFHKATKNFDLRYYKQINGGKHRAINKGVRLAQGKYFLILDSDDFLTSRAIENLLPLLQEIRHKEELAGVAVRRAYQDGRIVGREFKKPILSDSLGIRFKYKIEGDLVEIFKLGVLRKYPFPEIPGEYFCQESLIWNRIAQHYRLKFYNKGLYITEYLKGGLTAKSVKIRMQSPQASMLHYSELTKYKIPIRQKIKAGINFWRFAFNAKHIGFSEKIKQIGVWSVLLLPLGYFIYTRDKFFNR